MTPQDTQITPFETSGANAPVLRGETAGDGPSVVALHGLTATRRYVLHGSRLLARSGLRVVSYDARGHGDSDPALRPADYGYPELVADLGRVLAEQAPGRPVLAGVSMGAHTALSHVLERPDEVSALVLITPAYDGSPPQDLGDWELMASAVARGDIDAFVELSGASRLPERVREPAVIATRQRMERHRSLGAVADALRAVPRSSPFEGLGALATIDVPALVVGSRDEADPAHPLAVAEEYARRLPRAELLVEDPGESPIAWRGSRLSRAILEFLS